MVNTRSGRSSSKIIKTTPSKKQVDYKEAAKSAETFFKSAFPARRSPCYVDRKAILPYFKKQYGNQQARMQQADKKSFRLRQEQPPNTINPLQYSQSSSQINSHASTENKVDYSQMRECLQDFDQEFGDAFNKAHNYHEQIQLEILQQCSYVSEADIEIQERLADSQRVDNEMRPQPQHQSFNMNQNHQEPDLYVQIVELLPNIPEQLPQMNDNAVAFGPPNIDDLSTNQTLNPHSRSIQMPQVNINHVFIENAQNVFENLSEISTKACMSHQENSLNFNEDANQPTQDQYQLILWNSQQNLYLYKDGNEKQNIRLNKFLNIMLDHATNRSNRNLNPKEREQFWSLMTVVGINIHRQNIEKMAELIMKHEENESNICNHLEYCLIKERIDNINFLLSNSLIRQ